LLGIKEVPVNQLIANKTYLFFSHTIKKQKQNRKLLQSIVEKKIRLIDYETLTNDKGWRIIGFGRHAGIVGAHYALLMWGKRKDQYHLKKAADCLDYSEMTAQYKNISMGNLKILLTGGGRVAGGSAEVLEKAAVQRISPSDYLHSGFHNQAVFTQIDVDLMYRHKKGKEFDFQHFFRYPEEYENNMQAYLSETDILINAIYWDPRAPVLFNKKDLTANKFRIQSIADISCDIEGSVPLTVRASTIADPVYGINKYSLEECPPYSKDGIDIMAVDNLPNELPRDASDTFGKTLTADVLPLLIHTPHDPILQRACIAENGTLTETYAYLEDYLNEKKQNP
jgi:saccharopine dehydrogenase (NAD+, L-lysine forming)